MKKTFSILMTLALVLVSVAAVSAQIGDDAVTSNTSWTFQNLGSAAAEVGVKLYDTTGAMVAEDSFTVEKAQSFWAPDYAKLTGAFNGALVANSSQPLASIVNQVAANGTNGKTGNATYMGFTADNVAPTMYAPVAMKAFFGYYTELSIQSAGGDVPVTVTYYNQDGTVATTSKYNVKAGSPLRVPQAEEVNLPNDYNGGVKIAADDGTTPLAVVVNEFVGTGGGMYNQFYSYEAFSAGSTKVVLPAVFINGYGSFNASTSIQNMGDSDAEVTWKFYDVTNGNPNPTEVIYTQTTTIPTSVSIYFPDAAYADTLKNAYSAGDDAWIGSITLESNQPIIAIVNELNGSYLAASYTGFSEGATELYFPLALVSAYGSNFNTSFSIADMSTEGGDVSVKVEYIADTDKCAGCTNDTKEYTFQNTNSPYQPDHISATAMDNGVFIGSVKITSDKPINGIMNELLGDVTAPQDVFTSFNAFYTAE